MSERFDTRVPIEIRYCAVCGYLPVAVWLATEVWHAFGGYAPVTLTPVGGGRLELLADGEVLFDRKAEGGAYPDMKRVLEVKRAIRARLEGGETPQSDQRERHSRATHQS